jgi:hypothetical protein
MTKMATRLDPFPRVALASLPTPLEPLPRLSEFLGGPRILVKRDDQTGLALAGNKARKLEYLAATRWSSGIPAGRRRCSPIATFSEARPPRDADQIRLLLEKDSSLRRFRT